MRSNVVGADNRKAVAVATSPSATPRPLSPQSLAQKKSLEEQKSEIQKIVGNRRAERGYEHKVHCSSYPGASQETPAAAEGI